MTKAPSLLYTSGTEELIGGLTLMSIEDYEEDQQSVYQWASETFDNKTIEYRALMVLEEAIELCASTKLNLSTIEDFTKKKLDKIYKLLDDTEDYNHSKEEASDVLSCLYAFAGLLNFDLHEGLDRKMRLNRSRNKEYYDRKTKEKGF